MEKEGEPKGFGRRGRRTGKREREGVYGRHVEGRCSISSLVYRPDPTLVLGGSRRRSSERTGLIGKG